MEIFLLTFPIMLIVLTGYVSARFSLLTHDSSEQFTRLAFYIAIPCQLFFMLSKTSFSQAININYILAYALCVIITGSIIFLISSFIFKRSLAESSLNIMGSSMTNTAYFAIPLFILLFNNPAPVIFILFFQLIVMTTFILIVIENEIGKKISNNILLISFKNPIIISSLLGIVFSLYHIHLPVFFNNYLSIVGSTAAPLVLFALGQSLYSDLRKIAKNEFMEVLMLIVTKLFIMPMLAFIIGKYVFMLNSFWLASLIIMSAMPTPNNMFIFSLKYKLDVKKASTVVSLTTLLSFITLNILFFIFKPT
jgi:malonate transporter